MKIAQHATNGAQLGSRSHQVAGLGCKTLIYKIFQKSLASRRLSASNAAVFSVLTGHECPTHGGTPNLRHVALGRVHEAIMMAGLGCKTLIYKIFQKSLASRRLSASNAAVFSVLTGHECPTHGGTPNLRHVARGARA
jgi:hypothetical protein